MLSEAVRGEHEVVHAAFVKEGQRAKTNEAWGSVWANKDRKRTVEIYSDVVVRQFCVCLCVCHDSHSYMLCTTLHRLTLTNIKSTRSLVSSVGSGVRTGFWIWRMPSCFIEIHLSGMPKRPYKQENFIAKMFEIWFGKTKKMRNMQVYQVCKTNPNINNNLWCVCPPPVALWRTYTILPKALASLPSHSYKLQWQPILNL